MLIQGEKIDNIINYCQVQIVMDKTLCGRIDGIYLLPERNIRLYCLILRERILCPTHQKWGRKCMKKKHTKSSQEY
jgi:hypothetical protein